MISSSSYSDDYFDRIQGGALRSALCAVPIILEYIDLSSVIDVGCGSGAWLSAFQQHGVRDVIGVDGAWVNADRLPFSAERFVASDLTKPLHLDRQFDLVLSFEVAEHLAPDCAKTFVESLTSLGPVILFSAAVPGQGGTDHVNERWPDYWARLFAGFGFRPVDCLRSRFWGLEEIDWWYQQNVVFYVREESLADFEHLQSAAAESSGLPEALVHPRLKSWSDWYGTRERLIGELNLHLPVGASIAIAAGEQLEIELEENRTTRSFNEHSGVPLGPPADDRAAAAEVEKLLVDKVDFIVIPWIADWWVDAYPSLMRRLDSFPRLHSINCARVVDCRGEHPV